ncbi:MAG: WYL domain-containing protein [Lachnospiraceae bacterium]|nr:WYL domain-containing protein [Lachnospiraceae bacterium]
MGLISDKKMLPLIILLVLWQNSDDSHHLPSDEVVEKVLEIYQPKESCTYNSNKRLIMSYLSDLIVFFEQMKEYGFLDCDVEISRESIKGEKGNNHEYYVSERPLNDVEIRMLIDAILFAPGMDDERAKGLIDKVVSFTSKHFVNVHRYIRIGNIVKKTDNTEVVKNIGVLGEAIEKRKRVSFVYRDKRCDGVSPYYLAVYSGRYYCLGRSKGERRLSHYRLDRINDCEPVDEPAYDIRLLDDVGPDGRFDLAEYLKRHPRMTRDVVVTVILVVREEFMDTVRQEFQIDVEYPRYISRDEGVRRVKVTSCKGALTNWLINVPELVWVENDDHSGVVEEMKARAQRVMKVYG